MNNKLYKLMNWPEIEGVVYSECVYPKSILGGHLSKEGFLIQVYRPDAKSVTAKIDGKKTEYPLECVDEEGYFATLISSKKVVKYTLTVETKDGKTFSYVDPYALENVYTKKDFKKYLAGEDNDCKKLLGSNITTVGGVKGTLFTVWAPMATNVALVGEFNNFNNTLNPMERIEDTGVFELFMPGVGAGVEYAFDIKSRAGVVTRKLDPMTSNISKNMNSVVTAESSFAWTDAEWLKKRKAKSAKKPMSIYEVNIVGWAAKSGKKTYATIAEDLAAYVKAQGYTHVSLMPVSENCKDFMYGFSSVAYFAPDKRYGDSNGFKKMVDILHKEGISVILNWNCAYFGTEEIGLYDFDGASAYGYLRPRLEKNNSWEVVTFDYKKGAVRSFLKSNLLMWLEDYHIDGIVIDGVASMLYLDYGKNPSTWEPNIYGGNENLEAIEFLKEVNALIEKRADGVISIAEESSGWGGVTKANDGNSLGFDYKLNNGWKKDFLEFISTDPLFRKGEYDKLTYGMLYNYSENYILPLTFDNFDSDEKAFYSIVSGAWQEDRLSDVRAALGYFYTHPGSKLITMGQDIALDKGFNTTKEYWENASSENYKAMEKYIADLNKLFTSKNALYELDDETDGFEWLENSNKNETVIAYTRQNKLGDKLTVVINFTPVERENYRLPVAEPGKYKEVFNSSLKKYGGKGKVNNKFTNSDNEDMGGKDYIDITLPASSIVIYECTPYTCIELEEIAVIKKAAIAKRDAEQKALEARNLQEQAEAEAARALEAEKLAKEAAKAAVKARDEAIRRANEALELSKRIDEETKQKLEELAAMKNK